MKPAPFYALLTILVLLAAAPRAAAKEKEPEVEPAPEGVLLGRFFIRDLRPIEGAKIRLSFALYAEVEADKAQSVEALVEKRRHRIRNEVIIAVRTTDQPEFQEPDLERFRRRILMRLRRAEPAIPVQQLLIGEFEYFVE